MKLLKLTETYQINLEAVALIETVPENPETKTDMKYVIHFDSHPPLTFWGETAAAVKAVIENQQQNSMLATAMQRSLTHGA